MTIPTVAVTVKCFNPDGTACPDGTRVSAVLDQLEIYQGLVAPRQVQALTVAGVAVLHLFPNNPTTGLGTTGSSYLVSAGWPGSAGFAVTCQIPNNDCTLDAIADRDVLPPLDAAQVALAGAQAASGSAGSSATSAATSASNAVDNANAAYNFRQQAAISAASALSASNAASASLPATGATPPLSPTPGKEWTSSVTGKRYTWYDDGTSAQWVESAGFYYVDDPVSVAAAAASATAAAASAASVGSSATAAAASATAAAASATTAATQLATANAVANLILIGL